MSSDSTNNESNALNMKVLPLSTQTRFFFIKQNYGHTAYKTFHYFEKTTVKLVRLWCDLSYLNECRWNNLMPRFLYFKASNPMLIYTKAYIKCQHILLKEEIILKKHSIKNLSMSVRKTYDALANIFPPDIMTKINEIIDEIQFEEKSIKYWGHWKKLQTLINNRDKQQ